MNPVRVFEARPISPGKASGPALVTSERLGFRESIDLEHGRFSEAEGMGELEGKSFAGAVLIFPASKGSTTWSLVLDIACRFGNAPAAIVNSKIDAFVALSCALQDIPLVEVADPSIFSQIRNGDLVTVDANKGEVTVCAPPDS